MANVPAFKGVDETARIGVFVNGQFVHVPLSGILTPKNLAGLGLGSTITELDGTTGNTTFTVKAGWAIENIFAINTTANAVALSIGTTSGGTDVLPSWKIGANAIADTFQSLDWFLRKRLFSTSNDQTIYVQSSDWNSASLKLRIIQTKIF